MPKNSQNSFSCSLLACFRNPPGTITYHVQENGYDQSNEKSTKLDECHRGVRILGDSVMVMAYSTDPYVRFRQVMTEMLEYRLEQRMVVDWDYLEELLTCYMELNEKNCHGDILMAYVDVVTEFHLPGM
ncbi:hypothetical protein SLA2020_285690 [Shorea laevis]